MVVPTSVLSTDAGVVRVTAPGSKFCEGATDTPGDGLRLETVNPNYDLTNLRPPGFEPHVSGMDFLPDGRMVLTTSGDVSAGGWVPNPESGEVFILSHVTGTTSTSQVTYTKVAGGLRNPMGIQVIGDRCYVSERGQLTELAPDTTGDGLMEKKTLATWPNGGNFHEFAFGLIHDDDFFYVARSVAINNGGATTDPQPGQTPGTAIKIDRDTWQVSTIAGGLRTPNGIGFGPEGEIFVNDNQGAWLPANKMVHIKQDRFFNHFTNPSGPFDTKPVTQPVLWMPQNEIANSPSNPVLLKDGPVRGPDAVGRRHLRRPAARLPREGRRRVPGRGLPPLGGPRGRRQPHGDRPRRRDLRRRHRRGRQLGRGQQAPVRPAEADARTAATSSTWRR